MRYKYQLLTVFLSLIISMSVQAQVVNKGVEFEALNKRMAKGIRVPRELHDSCSSSFFTMLLKVESDNKVGNIYFSEGTPQNFQQIITASKAVFAETEWKKIFPGVGNKRTFLVLIPVVYYVSEDCYEKIISEKFVQILQKGFDISRGGSDPVFLYPPHVIKIYKTQH